MFEVALEVGLLKQVKFDSAQMLKNCLMFVL